MLIGLKSREKKVKKKKEVNKRKTLKIQKDKSNHMSNQNKIRDIMKNHMREGIMVVVLMKRNRYTLVKSILIIVRITDRKRNTVDLLLDPQYLPLPQALPRDVVEAEMAGKTTTTMIMGSLTQKEIHTINGKRVRFTRVGRIMDLIERNPIAVETGYMVIRKELKITLLVRVISNEANLSRKNTIMRNHDFTRRNLPTIGIEEIMIVKDSMETERKLDIDHHRSIQDKIMIDPIPKLIQDKSHYRR